MKAKIKQLKWEDEDTFLSPDNDWLDVVRADGTSYIYYSITRISDSQYRAERMPSDYPGTKLGTSPTYEGAKELCQFDFELEVKSYLNIESEGE